MSPAKRSKDERSQVYADWVNAGLLKPGKSGSKLADILGIEDTQISKLRHNRRKIQAQELELIAAYIEEPIPFRDPSLTNGDSGAGGGSHSAYDGTGKKSGKRQQPLDVLMHRFIGLRQKSLVVNDRAMSAVIPPGDTVIYVPYWDAHKRLHEGLVVVKYRGKLICRRLLKEDGGWALRAEAERVADQAATIKVKFGKESFIAGGLPKEAIIGLVIWRGRAFN